MELSLWQERCNSIDSALGGLEDLLKVNLLPFESVVRDGLQNGQAQKFEYCAEALWKLAKLFLYEKHGLDEASPKSVYAALYRIDLVTENELRQLNEIVDFRNRLSHLYKRAVFEKIIAELPAAALLLRATFEKLRANT